jgi:hypothetical protein
MCAVFFKHQRATNHSGQRYRNGAMQLPPDYRSRQTAQNCNTKIQKNMANAAATGAGKLPKTALVKFSTSLYNDLNK